MNFFFNKLNFIKITIYSILSIISLTLLLFFSDFINIDNKFLNRSTIHIDIKNLNSKHSKKLITNLRFYYLKFYKSINPKSYERRWGIEDSFERSKLEKEILIPAIRENFSKPLYSSSDYEISNNWFRSHGNYFSTRFSSLNKINASNANNVELAWIYEPNEELEYLYNIQANPIFINGNIYTPNSQNEIISIDAVSGKQKWKFKVEEGLAAKRGLIFFDVNKYPLLKNSKSPNVISQRLYFANNRGKLYSIDAKNGQPVKEFGKNGTVKVGVTPLPPVIYKDNLISIDTQTNLVVLDVLTGKIKWKYKINLEKKSLFFDNFFKGSPWGGLSLDYKRGLIFLTTGNPEWWHVGINRPGNNLYANSVIAFDINEKKIKWHFQEIAHDLWNMDLAAAPILTTIKKDNQTIDVVVAVSKLGNTLILDRETGKSLFDLKKVLTPTSNVPGERTSPYQYDIELPEPVCRNKMTKDELSDLYYVDKKRLLDIYSNSKPSFPEPPKIGTKSILIAGCVRWAGASVDTKNNMLYVNTDQQPTLVSIIENKIWKGSYNHLWENFLDKKNYPAIKPPWGSIVALNLNTGLIEWKIPFGEYEELSKLGIPKTGTDNRSGLTATKGDLIFASGTRDNKFVILNSLNGEEVWSYKMTHPGSAPPLTYEVNGKQYILVPAFESGGKKIYSFFLNN